MLLDHTYARTSKPSTIVCPHVNPNNTKSNNYSYCKIRFKTEHPYLCR
jgi:hypothetical protein